MAKKKGGLSAEFKNGSKGGASLIKKGVRKK